MGSSLDEFECPKCGRMATRDQDNKTCEVHVSCRCGWSGEEVSEDEKRPAEYKKIITGFVSQNFEFVNGEYVCTGQEFVAGDEVSRENEYGEPIETGDFEEEEVYFPMEMEQPEKTTKKIRKKRQ